MKDGQKITFHGEGDQEPGLEPGDIIIVLDQKDHAVFTRIEEDIFSCYIFVHCFLSSCFFFKLNNNNI